MRGKFHVIPQCLPDEHARGYAGRIGQINGNLTRIELRQTASHWIEGDQSTSIKEAIWLARISGIDPSNFVQNHTLVPFFHFVTSKCRDGGLHGSEASPESLNASLRIGRRSVQFCRRCINEDISNYGTSYWKREHLLPGRAWCSKHLYALARLEDIDIFSDSPAGANAKAIQNDEPWVERLKHQPIINRFLAIQDGVLDHQGALLQASVSRMLRDRALVLGFRGGRSDTKGSLLSQHLFQNVDHAWLRYTFPRSIDNTGDDYVGSIDSATRGDHDSCSPVAYVMAAAVFWDDANEALDALLSAERLDNPRQTRPRDQPLTDVYDLEQAYADAKGSHYRVANNLGLPKASVASSLKKLGLPAMGDKPDQHLINAMRMFGQGASLLAAATMNQVEVGVLENLVRRSIDRFSSAVQGWSETAETEAA